MAGHIVVGTAGWSQPDFATDWYPAGLPPRDRLRWYAERFEAVEVASPLSGRSFVAYRKADGTGGPWYAADLLEKAQVIAAPPPAKLPYCSGQPQEIASGEWWPSDSTYSSVAA